MQKIKIIVSPAHYYLDDKSGGSEFSWVTKILSGLLKQEKFSIAIITGFVKNFTAAADVISIKKRYGTSVFDAFIFVVKNYVATSRILAKKDCQVIHHMLPFLNDVTFDLNFLLRSKKRYAFILGPLQSPHTITSHEEFSFSEQGFDIKLSQKISAQISNLLKAVAGPVLRYLSRKTLRKADKIIVINEHAKNLFQEHSDSSKIIVIPPGIDVDAFSYTDFSDKNTDVIELLTVGYLIKRKGIDLIIQALKEITKVHKNVRLRIIGDGPQISPLKQLALELNVNEYIVFQGFVPNNKIQPYYQQAHIFISMSRSESWGQMYLEAMACGLPVISAKNIGSLSIVRDGQFGFLVEQEDYQGLADRVIYLLNNINLITNFGKRARSETESKYNWETAIIPKYIDLYRSCGVTDAKFEQ